MKVLLFQPLIPQNVGNIARTCLALNTTLVLVRPIGFSLSERQIRRAGMDYWSKVKLEVIDDLQEYLKNYDSFYFFSSKAYKESRKACFKEDSLLIFGNEREGLPSYLFTLWEDRFLKIKMQEGVRCFNLANSVAIALYEASSKLSFTTLSF